MILLHIQIRLKGLAVLDSMPPPKRISVTVIIIQSERSQHKAFLNPNDLLWAISYLTQIPKIIITYFHNSSLFSMTLHEIISNPSSMQPTLATSGIDRFSQNAHYFLNLSVRM